MFVPLCRDMFEISLKLYVWLVIIFWGGPHKNSSFWPLGDFLLDLTGHTAAAFCNLKLRVATTFWKIDFEQKMFKKPFWSIFDFNEKSFWYDLTSSSGVTWVRRMTKWNLILSSSLRIKLFSSFCLRLLLVAAVAVVVCYRHRHHLLTFPSTKFEASNHSKGLRSAKND